MSTRVLIFCVSAYFVEIVINGCRSKMARFQPSFSGKFTSLELKDIHVTGKELGKGSDATVQEVSWLGTLCAAKQLHEILLEDNSPGGARRFIENFEKECMTWSHLVHPCIVQFLGVHFLSGSRVPMLILEKMDTSLRNYLEAHKKEEFPLPDKVYVLRQVAQALSYLHNLSPPLVHHDLSPNNVLLNDISLQAKVTDFGMTRALDPSKMTRKSSVKGTQAFMPPEGLVDPPKYDEKLDIFSYGNVIITTTTHMWPNPGQPTKLEGKKLIGISELQRRQQYLDQFTPKEKELFLPVVRACLQNDPSERPTSNQLVTQMNKIEEAHPRVPDSVVISQLRQTVDEKNALLDQNLALLHQKDAQLRDSQKQLRKKDAQLQKLQKEMEEIHVKNLKSSISSPEWKQLLDTVGVTERELQDQDIVQFIHDFVQQHGGIEEANRQLDESKQIQSLPPPTRTSSRSAVTPPPNQGQEPPPLPEQGLGPDPPPPPPPVSKSSFSSSEWKRFFDTAGVTETQLQDQDTAQFIYDFVQQHGGIEEATKHLDESKQIQALPPPAKTLSRSAVLPPPNQGQEPPSLPEQGLGPDPPPPPPPASKVAKRPSRNWRDMKCQKILKCGGECLSVATKADLIAVCVQRGIELYSRPSNKLLRKISNDQLGSDLCGVPFLDKETIVVSGYNKQNLKLFTTKGELLRTIDRGNTTFRPRGVTVSPDGHIYVCDGANHCVRVFDVKGKSLFSFSSHGSGDECFDCPRDLCFASDGLLYITDVANSRICVYDKDGKFIRKFPTTCKPICIDATDCGHLIVSSSSSHKVMIYTTGGELVDVFGERGSEVGQFAYPSGVSVDSDGLIYIADYLNCRIQMF